MSNQMVYFGVTSVTTNDEGVAHVSHAKLTGKNFMAICIPDTPRAAAGCVVTNPTADGFDILVIDKNGVSLKNVSLWIRYVAVSNYY